jgi:hypothetical protein
VGDAAVARQQTMTLVLSCVTPDFVVQASDRRLTRSDGRLADDEANKATVFCGHWMIAYTGLAELGPAVPPGNRPRTDVWLATLLSDPKLSAKDGFDRVATAAEQELQGVRLPMEQKRHTFVCVGWGRSDRVLGELWPALVVISNHVDAKGNERPVSSAFTVDGVMLNPERRHYWAPHGQVLFGDEMIHLNRLIKKAVRRESPLAVGLLLARQIRAVAARNKLVGNSIMLGIFPKTDVPADGVSISLSGPPDANRLSFAYLPRDVDSIIQYAPNFACGFAMWGMQTSTAPLPPP